MRPESSLLLNFQFLHLSINGQVIAFQLLDLRSIQVADHVEPFHILLQYLDGSHQSSIILACHYTFTCSFFWLGILLLAVFSDFHRLLPQFLYSRMSRVRQLVELMNFQSKERAVSLDLKTVRNIQNYFTAELVISLFESQNRTCIKLIANSEIIQRKLLQKWKMQPSSIDLRLDLCRFFSQIIPFGDSFKIFSLYKEFDFVRAYLYERYPRQFVELIQFLLEVLELGEKFKENGRNVFVDTLYKQGAVQRWQKHMLSRDQQLANIIYMIYYRFIDP